MRILPTLLASLLCVASGLGQGNSIPRPSAGKSNGQAGGQIGGQVSTPVGGQITGVIPGSPAAPSLPPGSSAPTGTGGGFRLIEPRTPPALSPGQLLLLDLEAKFQQAVVAGGGRAFSSFFAEDAVVLSNGKPVVSGRDAIAAQAQWDAKTYQLTWNPEGAQMGPSGDMGFTWGHYDGRMLVPATPGEPSTTTSGRYFTVWKKLTDGSWKVSLEASADEPPAQAACCTVPHP